MFRFKTAALVKTANSKRSGRRIKNVLPLILWCFVLCCFVLCFFAPTVTFVPSAPAVRAESAAAPDLDDDFNTPDGMTSEDIAVKIDEAQSVSSADKTTYLIAFLLCPAAIVAAILLARLYVKKRKAKRKGRRDEIMKRQKEATEKFAAKNPALYADVADMAYLNNCRFIYAREDGVLFQENGGFYKHGAYIFAAESENAARKILLLCPEELENIGNGLLMCHGEKISAFCRDFFAFDSVTPCYQAVYRPTSPLPLKGALRFEKASEAYLPAIVETYKRETPEALEKLVRQGKIYCAFAATAQGDGAQKEAFVGYIGQHPEGSMGLLYIFPEFRRRGYAEELESFLINAVLAEGRTPYAHIIEDNFKSFALQQKLGAIFADDKVVWMSRSSRKRE